MKPHRWSGWPGAYCLDCFSEDPLEVYMHDESVMEWLNDGDGWEIKIRPECELPIALMMICPFIGMEETRRLNAQYEEDRARYREANPHRTKP